MSYVLRFESESDKHDKIFEFGGVRVFIDPKSFIYLRGMTLDFEEHFDAPGLRLQQPECHEVVRLRHVVLVKVEHDFTGC